MPAKAISHASDLLLIHVLLQSRVDVLPPLEKHRFANKLEPGSKLEFGIGEELLLLVGVDVSRVPHLVQVGLKVDIGLDEKDIVDLSEC